MQTINIEQYKTPFGELTLGSYDGQLCLCDWTYRKMRSAIDKRIQTILSAQFEEKPCEILSKTRSQLDEYFQKNRTQFDLPLLMVGTDFQQSVWNALLSTTYGSTTSYLELANSVNNIKAVRAVANANGANAISIIIPCHRVIGSNGELTGYAGGLPAKKRLLELERS